MHGNLKETSATT